MAADPWREAAIGFWRQTIGLPDRVILFEFPDMETLNTWYRSPEYQPLIALRQSATDMSKDMMIALEA